MKYIKKKISPSDRIEPFRPESSDIQMFRHGHISLFRPLVSYLTGRNVVAFGDFFIEFLDVGESGNEARWRTVGLLAMED